jgi:hypothetical protein
MMHARPTPEPGPFRLTVLLVALVLVPRVHPPAGYPEVALEPVASTTAIESAYDVEVGTAGGVGLLLDVHRPC